MAGNQFGDDWDSLSDEQKIARKEQMGGQGGSGGQGKSGGMQGGAKNFDSGGEGGSGQGGLGGLGDDWDTLSDEQKIARKEQRDGGR